LPTQSTEELSLHIDVHPYEPRSCITIAMMGTLRPEKSENLDPRRSRNMTVSMTTDWLRINIATSGKGTLPGKHRVILIAENGNVIETEKERKKGNETETETESATATAHENLKSRLGRSTIAARREVARPVRIIQAFGKAYRLLLPLLLVLLSPVLRPRNLAVQMMTQTVRTRIVSTAEGAIITQAMNQAPISSLAVWSGT
jgi:hypothetical protein